MDDVYFFCLDFLKVFHAILAICNTTCVVNISKFYLPVEILTHANRLVHQHLSINALDSRF